jgi:23S rRNA (guanosine2251-2'-O)-methyltransferase
MKNTKEEKKEIIYGVNPIVELLKARRRKILTLYTVKPYPKGWQKIEQYFAQRTPPVQIVTREVLTRFAQNSDHQGIVAVCSPFIFRKTFFDPAKSRFLVMLDGIQDPRNLGAILRSAYCTGADGVIITKKHSASLNATVFKASAGLAEHLEIYESPSAIAAMQELKKYNYTVYLAGFGGKDSLTISYKAPLCIVIGSEGTGVSSVLYKEASIITLPQRNPDISYNAAVAASILMFFISHQKN